MDFLQLFGGVLAIVFGIIFCWGIIENALMLVDKTKHDKAVRTKAFWYFLGHVVLVTFLAVSAYWLLAR